MTAISVINKLIRDTMNLVLVTPDYAVQARQKDAPRPLGSYGDVAYVSGTDLGWEQKSLSNNINDNDLTESIQGVRELTIGVNFYRDSAIDNARKVRTGLVRESIQVLFKAANIGLTRRSEVREISKSLENGWEERAQFDIVLNTIGTDSDIVNAILSVNMAAEFQFRGIKYNTTIEV